MASVNALSNSDVTSSSYSSTEGDIEFYDMAASGGDRRPTAAWDGKVLSASEKVKIRCSPRSCRVRWVRSKGAILVLLWNCLCVSRTTLLLVVPHLLDLSASPNTTAITSSVLQALSFFLLYPFSGWIADVYFGRYKVIHVSLWLMWAGVMLLAVSLCIKTAVGESYTPVEYIILPIALLVIECGIAGFKANIVPFGTDQLQESSGNELSAYIHWYIFTANVSIVLAYFPYSCVIDNSENAAIILVLVQAAFLSLALCLDFCLKDWLVIEPGTRNPFRTIYHILSYAWINKRAKFRSSFTYHLEDIPSRIEMAKPQYGGPFTVEQVEDVKTFLRMFYVLLPISACIVVGVYAARSLPSLSNHLHSNDGCTAEFTLSRSLPFQGVLFILPTYELIVYPLLHNFIPSMLVRIGAGFLFYVASLVAQLILDAVGRHFVLISANNSALNLTDTCLFSVASTHKLDLDYSWLAIPGILLSLGLVFNVTAAYEFVFAQSPYSMKGLFVGLLYGLQGLYLLLGTAVQMPFRLGAVNTTIVFPSCTSIYLLVIIAISVAVLIWYVCAAWRYRRRQREQPENHHVFVEEYFDKYLRK